MSGPGDVDCGEHVWTLVGVTFAMDGSIEDYECVSCPAVSVRQPSSWRETYSQD